MKTLMKWAVSLTAVFLLLIAPGRINAADLPVSAFFGTYSGGGVAENEDSIYFAVTARDMDVVIRPAGAGFNVTWTSVIRRGGGLGPVTARYTADVSSASVSPGKSDATCPSSPMPRNTKSNSG